MKILFVGRAKGSGAASTILERQAESLINLGHLVDTFVFQGRGLFSYFRSLPSLLITIRNGRYNIIHAHYSSTALAVSLLPVRNLVVSLMGSDLLAASPFMLILIRFAAKVRWASTIVKTVQMKKVLQAKSTVVLPNGVDTAVFKSQNLDEARSHLRLDRNKIYLLFPSDPARAEKNYRLATESMKLIKRSNVELINLTGISPPSVINWMNAANVVLITSVREGSPNVLKEAMSCSRPVVSTDVGDASHILKGVDGCFIARNTPADFAEKLEMAIDFSLTRGTTKGRECIFDLQLDSTTVAGKLESLYSGVLDSR